MPFAKDMFLTRQKDKIHFFRTTSNSIAGYRFNNEILKLLSKKVFFLRKSGIRDLFLLKSLNILIENRKL